jgi:hypothetical protein
MRVAIGSDHAGFMLKEAVKDFLTAQHRDVLDLGTLLDEQGRVEAAIVNNTPLDRRSTGHSAAVDLYWIGFNEFTMFRCKAETRSCAEDLTIR